MAKNKTNRGFKGLSDILNGNVNPMGLNSTQIDGLLEPDENLNRVFDTREEYEEELLRQQQKAYQGNQYAKITYDAYQKSVFYESNKLASYLDYEQMEYFPEIATALNVLSEECTTQFDDGTMLKVESESKRIKTILENLFNNILQINVTLPFWTRNVCKFGDTFIYLKTEDGVGITKAMQMKNVEIKRIEGSNKDINDDSVYFEWEGKNEKFTEWQMLHFRLIGDDKKLPYGTSVLDKVRKVFKQLSLAEDAMMVYRITRAPERRVFRIPVGNLPAEDIPQYVDKMSAKFKKTPQVNQKGGQDFRYNMLTNDEDYFIPTRDGDNGALIETLPGAQNLSDIGDIEFLQKKLFSGLQIPKAFLGFEESAGDGKSLSMQDIRFARTVNRIQQTMLMELNKAAIIHLYILGFEEELNNFKLSLSKSSKQAEILDNEILSAKLDNFIKATTRIDGGFAPMSFTEAASKILGKSGDDIILSLQQQYVEAHEASKLNEDYINSNRINIGIFDKIESRYRVTKDSPEDENSDGSEGGDDFGGDSFGGGGGGFGLGGGIGNDFPDDTGGEETPDDEFGDDTDAL